MKIIETVCARRTRFFIDGLAQVMDKSRGADADEGAEHEIIYNYYDRY